MEDKNILKGRIQAILSRHVGRHRAIPAGALYRRVFDRPVQNKNNDLRPLRRLIHEMVHEDEEPTMIASSNHPVTGGYYIPIGQEAEEFVRQIERRGLADLARAAKMKKRSMPELLGQLALEYEDGHVRN